MYTYIERERERVSEIREGKNGGEWESWNMGRANEEPSEVSESLLQPQQLKCRPKPNSRL